MPYSFPPSAGGLVMASKTLPPSPELYPNPVTYFLTPTISCDYTSSK